MTVDGRWYGLGRVAEFLNLESIEFREYQFNIIRSVLDRGNTLVVLPTGLGKTVIGAGIIAHSLSHGRKALFLAPTKPLAEQHLSSLSRLLNIPAEKMLLLTGAVGKGKRKDAEEAAQVIVATPQTVANDLKAGNISLSSFGSVVFDECHRAVGRYAYTYIANECAARNILAVGLTASPGGKKERISALVKTLGIRQIEVRVSTDPDVARYVMPKNVHIVEVELSPTLRQIASALRPELTGSLAGLHKLGLFRSASIESIPRGRLIALGDQISRLPTNSYKYAAMFSYTKLLNLSHAYDLLVTEGIYPFSTYLESLYGREKKSRTLESLLKSPAVVSARAAASAALGRGEEHPKVLSVIEILGKNKGRKTILFAQYRSTIKMLSDYLCNNSFKAKPFIGKGEGITQEQQKATIAEFRSGAFDILVASSIGEEGMDIPGVEMVIFYEPIPNEIRNIQRRGRTGRLAAGEIYLLVARGTKDQVYLHISRQREAKMLEITRAINRSLALERPVARDGQSTLAV